MAEASSTMPTILLLGMTGAGKSKFISAALGTETSNINHGPIVGHDMKSCTKDVQAFEVTRPGEKGGSVRLVDTPGFDNSNGSGDSEQLKKIAKWLKTEPDTTISGILYLHDIQHWHFIKNLLMQPQDIRWPPGASIVTTNWPLVPEQFQFNEDAFKRHVTLDGKEVSIPRFDYTTESAWKIITAMKLDSSTAIKAEGLATELEGMCRRFASTRPKEKTFGRLFNGLFSHLFQ